MIAINTNGLHPDYTRLIQGHLLTVVEEPAGILHLLIFDRLNFFPPQRYEKLIIQLPRTRSEANRPFYYIGMQTSESNRRRYNSFDCVWRNLRTEFRARIQHDIGAPVLRRIVTSEKDTEGAYQGGN